MDYWYLKSYRHEFLKSSQDKLMFLTFWRSFDYLPLSGSTGKNSPGKILLQILALNAPTYIVGWENSSALSFSYCLRLQAVKIIFFELLFFQWMRVRWTLLAMLPQVIGCQASFGLCLFLDTRDWVLDHILETLQKCLEVLFHLGIN